MMTLLDIQKAISKKLNSKYNNYYIYVEEVKQGLKRPSFFINIMPISTDNFVAYQDKLINIDIMYFSKNETNAENLDMINLLEDLFKMTLEINDRVITIKSLNFKVVDDILHCSFSLDFTDGDIEIITIDTPVGQIELPITDINGELGYTQDSITIMQEIESEVE